MSRSRGYCYVVNNYTDLDIAQLMELWEDRFVTYIVIAFEIAPTTGTPHIQGYMHFEHGKTMRTVCDRVPRISLQEAKAEGENYDRRYTYCFKDHDYIEYGERPHNGVNTSSKKVIAAIEEGKTYKELVELFPSYMIHHGPKVKRYLHERKNSQVSTSKTKFYVICPVSDAITEVYEHFDIHSDDKVAVVTSLDQLEAYDEYLTVIYYCDYYERVQSLWPRGVPITYKYGYEIKKVLCQRFIIVTETPKLYPLYKKI